MWILKNSKDLLDYIQSRPLSSCNNIKTFDFSTFYATIPHTKLKGRLRELVQLCFIKRNGQRRYKYLVLGRDRSYFVRKHSDSTKRFAGTDIINMLQFLIDNIFIIFGGRVFQQTVDIPMGANCAPLLADLFLYSYEADFQPDPLISIPFYGYLVTMFCQPIQLRCFASLFRCDVWVAYLDMMFCYHIQFRCFASLFSYDVLLAYLVTMFCYPI